jgi:HlyD family secretion protein
MNASVSAGNRQPLPALAGAASGGGRILASIAFLILGLTACAPSEPERYLGYVEGRYVYLAPTAAGRIEALAAGEGDTVQAGAVVARLESTRERAEFDSAQAALAAAQARYEDRTKGRREDEVAVTRSQRRQAEADRAFQEAEFQRLESLYAKGSIARSQLDAQRAARDAARARVAELDAALRVAALASRDDELKAAAAEVAQAESRLESARWALSERELRAPAAALVQRVYLRVGEVAGAGEPLLALLPPPNRVLRFWVPEAAQSRLRAGATVRVHCKVCDAAGWAATVDYVSPAYEFTPPVLYTERRREKLSFMVEARLAPAQAAALNPGLPVEVTLE